MPEFLVSVPFTVAVWVEAESAEDIDEDLVYDALLDSCGKYPSVDGRSFVNFHILEENP